ncbi:MAG: lactate racemase domain-containing protein [Candidatus Heimdallarchaeota archaeon]
MSKIVKIPWAAWCEPNSLDLRFPGSWDVVTCRMNGAQDLELSDDDIKYSILNPIGTSKLLDLAREKKNAVIVIDDMTRTTQISRILPYVLEEIEEGGIRKAKITIIAAIGAHRPMNRQDFTLKLGKGIIDTMRIENHHPYENLTYIGESSKGTPIDVNSIYLKADLKISIGGVIPHGLAGFGGGAKMILPGVCGIRTLEANHSAGMRGIGAGIGRMTDIRRDIEEAVEKIGLDFSINAILNEEGKIAKLFSGHFKDAHRRAMEFGKQFYSTKVTLDNQICFFNSFPEDSELSQAQYKAFNFLMTAPNKILDRYGAIIIMTSSYEGRGYHSLLAETGSKLYKNLRDSVVWKSFIKKRRVYLFSPNVNEFDKNHFFPESVKLFNEWNNLIEELERKYGNSPKVAVFPCSTQIAEKSF